MTVRRLTRPLDYLRIEHPSKRYYDRWVPLFFATPMIIWFVFIPGGVSIFSPSGVVDKINGLLQILTGFYIASLAAVATFNKESMDKPMIGEPPILDVGEGKAPEILTRRRFLSLMFGYLALSSLFLYIMGIFAVSSAAVIKDILSDSLVVLVRAAGAIIYFFLFSNIVVTTLLGLFYMSDRIHRHEPELICPGEDETGTDSNEP